MKLSFAGLNKGFTGLGASVVSAAIRAGSAKEFAGQLADSQPGILAYLTRFVPAMFPKAYRRVAEMEEVAAFAGDDAPTRMIYEGIAQLYQRLADDLDGDKAEIGVLSGFVGTP